MELNIAKTCFCKVDIFYIETKHIANKSISSMLFLVGIAASRPIRALVVEVLVQWLGLYAEGRPQPSQLVASPFHPQCIS